jgi:hypothetical protein
MTEGFQAHIATNGHRARLEARRRTDLGILRWYLEVYNLLNAKNPCCVEEFDVAPGPGGEPVPDSDDRLPILPSFAVQFES